MNISLESLKGYSYKLKNSILRAEGMKGILIPSNNLLCYYEYGNKLVEVFRTTLNISSICISGSMIGIGTEGSKGSLTTTTIVNLKKNKQFINFIYQKTKTEKLSISKNCQYLCSIGSSTDTEQSLCILDIQFSNSILGTEVSFQETHYKKNGPIVDVQFSPKFEDQVLLLFSNKIVVYKIQKTVKNNKTNVDLYEQAQKSQVSKLSYKYDIQKYQIKSSKVRQFSMVIFHLDNIFCYVSSNNGDISELNMVQNRQTRIGPRKRVILSGIKLLRCLDKHNLVIIGQKGFIALIELKDLKIIKQVTLKEDIISLTQFNQQKIAFISTEKARIFKLHGETLEVTLYYTCHCAKINDIIFMDNFSTVFSTCAGSEIVIWKNQGMKQIIKIEVPMAICLCLNFTHDGKYLLSGWSDQAIRVISPLSGKIVHKLSNCHSGKITAITSTDLSDKLISGDDNGIIRVWNIEGKIFGIILGNLIYHKKTIHSLKKSQKHSWEIASASEDGHFALWNIDTFQKISSGQVCNYLKDIMFNSRFQLMCIGSGPCIYKLSKSSGKKISQIETNQNCLNTFATIECSSNKVFYVLGGDLEELIIVEQFPNLIQNIPIIGGEVTKLAVSPGNQNIIVGTSNGTLMSFRIQIVNDIIYE